MNILVISSNYPSLENPKMGVFVYKLIQIFAQDNNVVVISPQKYSFKKRLKSHYGNEKAVVFRPKKLSFSNKKIVFINSFHLTNYFQSRAIKKTIRKIESSPEIIYCHFIISAINYYQAFPDSIIPVYVAVGEYRNIDIIRRNFSEKYYKSFLDKVRGFIAVSQIIKEKLISLGVSSSKILVAPNGTDLSQFKPKNSIQLREKYNIPLNKKIVLFVGRYIESKGPLRVQEAIDKLSDDVIAIFIGNGNQKPNHDKIINVGLVDNKSVSDYMALSDVFVLPTLHEGSSNVIVEAMACGLPIVSSDIPEIRVQCKPDFSILVNPYDVNEIANGLDKILSNDKLREKMSKEAVKNSYQFDINLRAKTIFEFIQQ